MSAHLRALALIVREMAEKHTEEGNAYCWWCGARIVGGGRHRMEPHGEGCIITRLDGIIAESQL